MYMVHNLLSHHDPNQILAQGATFELINMSLYNDKDYLANRVSASFQPAGAEHDGCRQRARRR